MFLKGKDAAEILGVCQNTLRNLEKKNLIETYRTDGGQRRYNVDKYLSNRGEQKVVAYCRVSSQKQKDDLERQASFLQERFPEAEIIRDIGSGLNFKRKGLLSVLEYAMRGDKFTLVVTYKDRLCRFGFDLIRFIIERNGGKIVVLDRKEENQEQELVEDILSIIHVFSCRINGSRSHKNKKNPNKADQAPNEDIQEVDGCF